MRGDVLDVALGVTNDSSDALQHAEAIVAEDRQLYGISRRSGLVAGPFDIDAAFGFVHQVCHVGTMDRMHGHTFAARDVADDTFSTDGIATLGAIDEHVALAADGDSVVIA